jgi:hypothetical protein
LPHQEVERVFGGTTRLDGSQRGAVAFRGQLTGIPNFIMAIPGAVTIAKLIKQFGTYVRVPGLSAIA